MTNLLRSVLFVPGVRPDRFASAMASGADAVVFDLEDSVDATRKAEARDAIATFLSTPSEAATWRLVRINAVGGRWYDDDLTWAARLAHVDGVVLPKAESPDDVETVGRRSGSRRVIPLLETARGVLHAPAIAAAHAMIPALLFGAEDLTAQMGVPRTLGGEELIFARSQVAMAATTIGADAIDAVFIHITATDDLRTDAIRARAMGFRGKMAIHPGQVAIINDVFSPTPAEIERARQLVETYEAAVARGEGVLRVENQMIDTPVVNRAKRVLALADALAAGRDGAKPSR